MIVHKKRYQNNRITYATELYQGQHTKDPLLDHHFTDPHLSYWRHTALEMHPLPCMSALSQKIHGKIDSHKLMLAVLAVHRTTNTESHSSPLQSPRVLSSLKDFVETQFCTLRITLNCLLDFSIFSQEDYSICDSTKVTDLVPPPSLLQDKRANIVTCGLVVLGMGSITKRKCSRSPASAHPSSHVGIIISQKSSLNT
jgi:hypothetical protein